MKAANDNVPQWVVYTLADSRSPEDIRYLGITKNPNERLSGHRSSRDGSYRSNWAQSVIRGGADIIMSVVRRGLSLDQANDAERNLIAEYRAAGYRLVNATDGGDGASGHSHSKESREKIALARRALWQDQEYREKMDVIVRAVRNTPEYREKQRAAQLATWSDPEVLTRHKASLEAIDKSGMQKAAVRAASPSSRNSSGFKGIFFQPKRGKWAAAIQIDGKRLFLGRFSTPEEAARAYDNAAFAAFGFDCYLNFEEEKRAA